MRKILIYLILCLVLTSQTEFGQVFRVCFLVQHFHQHLDRDQSISVFSFLEMHYWGKDLEDNDHEQDQKLPFKTSSINPNYVFVINDPTCYKIPLKIYQSPAYFLPKNYELPEGYLHDLLKPPRIHTKSLTV